MSLQLFEDPTLWLLPLVYGLAVFALLLIIDRLLRRSGALHPLAIPYLIGALALSVAAGATTALAGRPLDRTFHDLLLAVIICSWGFVCTSSFTRGAMIVALEMMTTLPSCRSLRLRASWLVQSCCSISVERSLTIHA